nr:MAG TPA: hypothetical protein [Bacteriophage sp.]
MSITNEKLQIIKDNVSKVYRSGQMDVIKNANSLKGFESNKVMLLDDVSPVTHEMGVKVKSKNMFEGTLNSGIYENENFKISIADSTKFKSMKIYLSVGTYTLASSVSLMLVREVIDGVYGSIAKSGNTYTFSVTVDGDVGFSFRRSDDADWDDSDNVWLNEGSTAAEYTPYIPDLTAVKVSRYGKNLWDKDYAVLDSRWTQIGGNYAYIRIPVPKGSSVSVSYKKNTRYRNRYALIYSVCK